MTSLEIFIQAMSDYSGTVKTAAIKTGMELSEVAAGMIADIHPSTVTATINLSPEISECP